MYSAANKLDCLYLATIISPSIKYDSISAYLAVIHNAWLCVFLAEPVEIEDREGIDQEFVRFESERVTWLPQNDFHLVLSRQHDQYVRVSALAFDESFRQHGTYGKPLLFHFPRLRFLVLSKHSLAKVSSLLSFTPRVVWRKKVLLLYILSARSLVSFFSCGINREKKSSCSLFASGSDKKAAVG